MTTTAERLFDLKQKIRETALSYGRVPDSIHLVAVSKRKPVSDVQSAAKAGQIIFGENHVQEAAEKQAQCKNLNISWHMIGHLQRNKARAAAGIFDVIHSIDSVELAEKLNLELEKKIRKISCFIQIKLSPEETKTGISPDKLTPLVERILNLNHLNLIGLMGIPPYTPNPEDSAPYFRKLRQIRDNLNREILHSSPIHELSMGMSHDFRVAIREGATYIRIGTLLFGERSYDNRK
ncbi:MAG: YggS family pyridoxal phosphate-dependent enzyme [Acidobacteria bacterium]|nr:YggS family pyridoxal phosphate-dependent enzyme [Acidobacteriota bacterium]